MDFTDSSVKLISMIYQLIYAVIISGFADSDLNGLKDQPFSSKQILLNILPLFSSKSSEIFYLIEVAQLEKTQNI